jgi:hypothetical protein
LPNSYIEIDKEKFYANEFSGTLFSKLLDKTKPVEKYVAVLFYNHEKFVSNILEFKNENPPIDPAVHD